MRSIPRELTRLLVLGFLGVFLFGCGPDFDPPSELHSLRVLAVQKDKPYAKPGETVNLSMLWEDASTQAASRTVTVAWSGPCADPDADLYYACFKDATLFQGMVVGGPQLGNSTTVSIPSDIIKPRPPPNAPYGLVYVFFAACAGTLTPITTTSDTEFPIGCKGPDGQLLGSDDFVAGYTSIYSFGSYSNKNPIISGFEFNGSNASSFCLGDDCQALAGSTIPPTTDCDPDADQQCVHSCAADGDSSCQAYDIRPVLNQDDNQEQDDVSAQLLGRHVSEQMWIDYYTDSGGFKSPVRLLNDATSGWNDSYDTKFYPPKAVGPSRIYTVVHDNRGGVSWAGITVNVVP